MMITLNPIAGGSAARLQSRSPMFSGLRAAIAGLADGWRAYAAFDALNDLDDAALAARGLTRADLPRVAFETMNLRG